MSLALFLVSARHLPLPPHISHGTMPEPRHSLQVLAFGSDTASGDATVACIASSPSPSTAAAADSGLQVVAAHTAARPAEKINIRRY